MDRQTYETQKREAINTGDEETLKKLEYRAAAGRVEGVDASDVSMDTEEEETGAPTDSDLWETEVKRARVQGNEDRLQELEAMAANDEQANAGITSRHPGTRLQAEIQRAKTAGDDRTARQLKSIIDSGTVPEGLENAIQSLPEGHDRRQTFERIYDSLYN
jgi:hypothetical protein